MFYRLSKKHSSENRMLSILVHCQKENQKERKTKHSNSESSPLTGAGVSQAAVSSFQWL